MAYDPDNKEIPQDDDPVWKLISRVSAAHPVEPSPWFVTRTTARAHALPQGGQGRLTSILRWMIPLPLAGAAALLFLSLNHGGTSHHASIASTEQEFEQNMEFLFASSD